MIYIVTCLLYLLLDRRRNSIAKILFLLLLASSISAYMVGRQPSLSFDVSIYVLYTALLLLTLFSSFKYYSSLNDFTERDISVSRLKSIERIIVIVGVLTFLINIYIFSKVYSLLLIESITVQDHKNEGGAAATFSLFVPKFVITLSNLFSPIGYISLALHFYYLIKGKLKKSITHLLISLSISLSGMLALSRSSTTAFILIYFTLFIFIYPLINKKLRSKIIIFGSVVIFVILMLFITVSESRFTEYYTKNSLNTSIIDNEKQPMLFSILDYFSQWQENGPMMMSQHTPNDIYYGIYNSSGLAVQIERIINNGDYAREERERKIYNSIGLLMTKFHGSIARLVFDFGFIGTIVFVLTYSSIIRMLRPRRGVLSFKTLFFLPVILPFCVSFFSGNALSGLALNIAIIYAICIFIFIKKG